MEKYDVFKGLTSYLIEGTTIEGGWGNECGLRQETNPLNTAECLCGLILARHHLLSKKLDEKYDKTIESAINYLIKTQLKSGGWCTGATYQGVLDCQSIKAKGNMVSTCFSIMAISFYYIAYPDNDLKSELIDAVKKSFRYFKFKIDNLWAYSPEHKEKNLMATAYALLCLSYVQANIVGCREITNNEKNTLKSLIDGSIDNLLNHKEKYFTYGNKEQMVIVFIFIALCNLRKANYQSNSLIKLKDNLFSLIQSFSKEIISNCFTEKQSVRQIGENPRDFIHYMPIWIIVANSLTEVSINNFDVALNEIISNIDSNYQGCSCNSTSKRTTWATGITLMGLSLSCENLRFYKTETNKKIEEPRTTNIDSKKVFLVHGRDEERVNSIKSFLVDEIKLKILSWEDAVSLTGETSPSIFDVVSVALNNAQAVIVLFTGDDEVKLKEDFWEPSDREEEKKYSFQSRPNVIFEAGFSFGVNAKRTIIVQMGKHKDFSDILGKNYIKYDNSSISKEKLKNRLKIAECVFN